MVYIIDSGNTKFGRSNQDIIKLGATAAKDIVKRFHDAIDLVIVSNSYSGEYTGNSGINSLITTALSLDEVPSLRVDNTTASGSTAILLGRSLIEAGRVNTVLIIGVEKMSEVDTRRSSEIISSFLNPVERDAGLTLPSLAAFMARSYIREYGATRESIAMVSVKNHRNGSMNPIAQFQKAISLEDVLNSRIIADPLRLFEYCPISDGASAILMSSHEYAPSLSAKRVNVMETTVSSSSSVVSTRENFVSIDVVKKAAEQVFQKTWLYPRDIDFIELHDMATILEIVEAEDMGFFRKGEGWKAMKDGETELGGSIPINPSGGLISRGHPIGATGIAQAAEVFTQLTGKAGKRQVRGAERGLSLNMGGFGNSAIATIYEVV